ncbi:hypothetical protein Tco_0241267 [Tanacetum coccineum]
MGVRKTAKGFKIENVENDNQNAGRNKTLSLSRRGEGCQPRKWPLSLGYWGQCSANDSYADSLFVKEGIKNELGVVGLRIG